MVEEKTRKPKNPGAGHSIVRTFGITLMPDFSLPTLPMNNSLLNIFYLGVKELRNLARDTMMLVLIVFAFTGQV
jgi:hypothetical protein